MGNDTGMQYIMDWDGNYYRLNGDHQLVVAGGQEEATVFTFDEAYERIGGKKAKFYQAVPVEGTESEPEEISDPVRSNVISILGKGIPDQEDEQDKDMEHVTNDLKEKITAGQAKKAKKVPDMEYDISAIDWMDYMNLFCYLANSAKSYQEEMAAKHSAVDKELCDLLHYIELYDLTEEESMKAVDMVKDARMRRRDIKNKIQQVEIFHRSIGTSANVVKAKGGIKELGKIETQKYHPRELPELFKGMQSRITDRSNSNVLSKEDDTYEDFSQNTDIAPIQEVQQMEYNRRDTIFDGRVNDWNGFVKQQYEFFSNVQQYMINLELDLDAIDGAIEDVLTKIEDANYNVAQGYKAFKELKDLRNERKDKHEELQKLRTITECFDCEAMADAYGYTVDMICTDDEEETVERVAG